MDFIAVAIDDGGHTHIAASDYSGIHYFTDATGDWLRTDLTETPAGGSDIDPDIAVDSSGTVAIAFTRWTTWDYCVDLCEDPVTPVLDGVYYMTTQDNLWSTPERVVAAAQAPLIAFADSSLHLVTQTAERMAWSTLAEGGWLTLPVGDEESSATALVVNNNSVPRVVYRHAGGVELMELASSGVTYGIAVPQTQDAEWPRLAFDQLNRPHVMYGLYDSISESSQAWHTLMREDGTWSESTPLGLPSASAVAIDDHDTIHVVYLAIVEEYDLEDDSYWRWEEVWYASVEGDAAAAVRLDRSDSYEFGSTGVTTMALDSGGRPHVVFSANGLDFEGRGLFYALGPADDK